MSETKTLVKRVAWHVVGSAVRTLALALSFLLLTLVVLAWKWEALGWGTCADTQFRDVMHGQSSPGGIVVLPFVLMLALFRVLFGCAKEGLLLLAGLGGVVALVLLVAKRLVLQRALAGFYRSQGERLIALVVGRLVETAAVRELPVERVIAELGRLTARASTLPFVLRLIMRPVLEHVPTLPASPNLSAREALTAALRAGQVVVIDRWMTPPRWLYFVPAAPLLALVVWSWVRTAP